MRARWITFAVGAWLILAPLVLGYRTFPPVLHDVTLGLLVSVGALASFEWPVARHALVAPALWLLLASRALGWHALVARNEVACGVAVLVLALVPAGRVAGERSAAKMAA